jgi:GMP synthase (glutamine-hydrolysing)
LIFSSLPGTFPAFHWHGDTFKIPQEAKRIAKSEGCTNQAFECGRTIGLQFHLEYSKKSIDLMLQNCGDELVDGKYIQTPDEILSKIGNVHEMNRTLNLILDKMEHEFGARL